MDLFNYFEPIFYAVSSIFIVALISGALVRKKRITDQDIRSFSEITINLLLPALIFSKIIKNFHPTDFPFWWILPLIAFAMIGLGIIIASLFYLKQLNKKRAYVAIAGFMNANYMVLPIAKLAFPDRFDLFVTYVFLFVLGVNPALWSIGKYMLTADENKKLNWKGLLTPPFLANIISVFVVLLGLSKFIPDVVLTPINFMGEAAIPMATIVLGAIIGSISLKKLPPFSDIIKVVGTKLIILPALVIFILLQFSIPNYYPLLADMLVIEASVAPATQIVLQVKKYGGQMQQVGGLMFISYMICVITIPFWFTLWQYLLHT